MKKTALFINDTKFLYENSKYYNQSLSTAAWDRYLEHFDSLEIVARELKQNNKGSLSLSSRDELSFSLSQYYKHPIDEIPHWKEIERHLLACIQRVDAVIIRLPSILGLHATAICKRIKKPYAIEVVGCPRDTYWNYGGILGKILSPVNYLRMKKAVANSEFTVYVTKYYLQERYPCHHDSASISNVNIESYSISVLEKHLTLLKKHKCTLKLGMLGDISAQWKGYKVLLKALSEIKNKIPDFELSLAGGGDPAWINNLIEKLGMRDNVNVIGVLPSRQTVNDFLDNLDVYIQPSFAEGLPRATIEAMSRACPVLSSNAGGIPELIQEKYRHKAGDSKQLGEHLVQILNSRENLASMAKENFEHAKEYRQEIIKKKLYKFWSDFSNNI